MSDQGFARQVTDRTDGADGRRHQLRTLLLNAADTARQTRRVTNLAARAARPVGRAIRDRVSMLLSAAG
jgi:hypothetical protein